MPYHISGYIKFPRTNQDCTYHLVWNTYLGGKIAIVAIPINMDGFSTHIQPPPEYISVKWISDIFVFGMGLGWGTHYAVMTYVSIKDRTYCLNIMALCADFAWEVVYGFVYPSNDWAERAVIFVALLVNILVMYAAIRATPNEWQHSPLIMQNSLLVFVATTVLWLGGMLSMAAQLGPARAYSFGAILCQMLISVGQVCQLLSRNNTRGASYTLWYAIC